VQQAALAGFLPAKDRVGATVATAPDISGDVAEETPNLTGSVLVPKTPRRRADNALDVHAYRLSNSLDRQMTLSAASGQLKPLLSPAVHRRLEHLSGSNPIVALQSRRPGRFVRMEQPSK
jgi:hypothetical protein